MSHSARLLIAAISILTLGTTVVIPCARSAEPAMSDTNRKVVVIAHRGASALRPEHTLAAYARAIEDGADAIEPDLVSTKDGFLVARHENEIGSATDIGDHPEFAARKTRKSIDGGKVEGWFTEDFTLAELKKLRARERLPQLRSTQYDGQFEIATLDEIIDLVAAESMKRGRVIGIVPEIKHPTYFASLGLSMEDKLLAALAMYDYTRTAPVTIQSFETANLRTLRNKLGSAHPNIQLLQLLGDKGERPYDMVAAKQRTTYGDLMKPNGLREIAGYADAIGPSAKSVDLHINASGSHSTLIDEAHAAGLKVIVYTFRPENYFLGSAFKGDGGAAARNEAGSVDEMRSFIAAGIDALFTDDPALGRRAVDSP
jgi:glycerophosphoryl diester phosphodiesterase